MASRSSRCRSIAATSPRCAISSKSWGSPASPSITIPTGRAGRTLGAPGLPTTVLIDRSGQEVGRLLGPAEWDSDEAIAVIEALVGPAGSGPETPEDS